MFRLAKRNATALILATATALAATVTDGAAQEMVFTNASLQGTYSIQGWSIDGEIYQTRIIGGLIYFDGEGGSQVVWLIDNQPGEPDDDGKPTRNLVTIPDDPATWVFWPPNQYQVTYGGFFHQAIFDSIPVRVETINGTPMILEYSVVTRAVASFGGGVYLWRGTRIADENVLPPAPSD